MRSVPENGTSVKIEAGRTNILAMRERGSKDYKVESTPTLFVNGKMQKGGASIEELEKLMAPYFKS